MKHFTTSFLFVFFCFILQVASAEKTETNGEIKVENNIYFVWHTESKKWINIEDFWLAFTDKNNGLTWKASTEYPPYVKVKEFDTFIIITNKGNCLMQFFHTRWRRANDVQRWDDQINDYAGCPFVFDS